MPLERLPVLALSLAVNAPQNITAFVFLLFSFLCQFHFLGFFFFFIFSLFPSSESTFKADAKRSCVQRRSVAEGDWCHQSNEVCTSGMCHRGKCVGKSPVSCGNCVIGETCTCDGGYLMAGNGVCKEDKCQKLLSDYYECVAQNCEDNNMNYSQACANRLCIDSWNAYATCDPLLFLWD